MLDKINIHLTKTKKVDHNIISACLKLLNSVDTIRAHKLSIKPVELDDYFEWSDCFDKLNRIRIDNLIESKHFIVLLTEKANADNWFSAFSHSEKNNDAFVQTSDWQNYIYANEVNLIAYEILANIIHKIIFFNKNKNYNWVHQEPIGCVNDFCGWKQDAQFKFKTADICKDCLDIIENYISTDVLKDIIKLLNRIRRNVISTSKYFDAPSFEEDFFSPIALTKRKISSHSDPLRKTLFAIDHFDLLVKVHIYFSLAIGCEKNAIVSFLNSNMLSDKPSLGNWVIALSALSNQLTGSSTSDINLKKLNKITKNILSLAEQNNVVKIRNEERGHGYINCQDSKYSSIYKKLNHLLNEIEDEILNSFNNYYLVRPLSCSKKDINKYLITYNLLTGSNMLLEEKNKNIDFNPDFIDNHIYLISKDFRSWHDTYPYLILDNCPECHHQRLMIKDGCKYIDIYIGHRVSINSD